MSRPATDKQFNYLRSLFAARPDVLAGFGVATPDAAIDMLRNRPDFTTTAASGMIDQLKGIPATAAAVRPNNHPGRCERCGTRVMAGAGRIERNAAGKWLVYHLDGTCPEATAPVAPVPEVGPGLYVREETGAVWRLYMTRNDRLGAKVLHIHGASGSFEYVPGGVRTVREGVAAGTFRLVTEEEARAFGALYGFCCNCGVFIDDDRSLAAGYGPYCAANNGWSYPTYSEAAAILGRPCGPGKRERETAPVVPTCPECAVPLTDDVIGEPCYQAAPDYRGLHPLHTATGLAPQT